MLLVLGVLLVLLAVACLRESRSGRAAWGAHLADDLSGSTSWARAAERNRAAGAPLSGVQATPGA